jgi:hypothetical protein
VHLFNELKKISADKVLAIFNSIDAGLKEGKYK